MKERELWPGWETVRKIGSGSFSTVYEIRRALPNGDIEKAALKVITIPQNESDIDELYSSGYDNASITAHFRNYLADIVDEYALMSKIKGHTNVVYCDDVRYIQHIDGFGWDIFIKMELLTPLAKIKDIDNAEDFSIRLGRDICSALALCRKKNIIHRDIKPQNIFVSEDGNFKLGDFGIAKAVEKTTGGTKIGTYGYMAPEVYNNQPYGAAADIYSLGLVMYWLLNERRLPFLPLPPVIPKITDSEEARHRRFTGEPLPAPKNGSQELKRIVLKACAYDPANRYHTAEEMQADLTALCKASAAPKQAVPLPEEPPAEAEMDATMIDTDYPQVEETPQGDKQPKKVPGKRRKPRKKRKSPVLAVAISLLAAIALLYIGWTNCWFGHDTQAPAEKTQNVLKNTPPDTQVLPDMFKSYFGGQTEYMRGQVTSIVFSDAQAPDTAWDVSESGDRNILAWMDQGTLYITSPQKIMLPTNCHYLFAGFNKAKSIQFNNWVDTSDVTDMGFMFTNCTTLQQLNLSGFDTSNVWNMGGMFDACSSLQKLDLSGFNTANVTWMDSMFMNCDSIQQLDLSGFDTSKVGSMRSMFYGCNSLRQLDLSNFDTSKVTSMSDMFGQCESLQQLDVSSFDTSKVTDMSEMFGGCESLQQLDVSSFDTSEVTEMKRMFSQCESLKHLDISNFDTSNVYYMGSMFGWCKSLQQLDLSGFDTSKVKDVSYMFYDCPMLEMPDVSHWDFSKVISYENFMDEGKTVDGKPWIALFEPQETVSTQAPTENTQNIMKNTPPDTTSLSDMHMSYFLGQTEYTHGQVTSIVFSDAQAPDTAWDVSESGNRNILAWMDQGTLHISSPQKIVLPADCTYMFAGFKNVKSIQFNDWVDTSHVANMDFMFANCTSLQQLDLSGFDTSNVSGMFGMFYVCTSLQELDLSSFNTANVKYMTVMFDGCKSLQQLDLSNFNTSKVTSISQMFNACSSLQKLDLSSFNTANVTRMELMFRGCESLQQLDLSGFDTSNVTNMESMFSSCESLRELDLSGFETSKVINMRWMFGWCKSLRQLDLSGFDTSEVKDMSNMFYDCPMLEMPDVSHWDFSKVISYESFMDEGKTVDGKPWITLFEPQETVSTQALTAITQNIMKNTPPDTQSFSDMYKTYFLGQTEYTRGQVSAIVFSDAQAPDTAWDVSESGNRNILAWMDQGTLHISSPQKIVFPSDCSDMFAGFSNAKSIQFNNWVDTSNVCSMQAMFYGCSSLQELDLSSFNTVGVDEMSLMFGKCSSLQQLDLSGFDTSKVTHMLMMFEWCSSLQQLDLSSFDTSNVCSMCAMFAGCKSLQQLDVSEFDTSKVTDMSRMFSWCSSLQQLDLSNFDTSNVTDMSYTFYVCWVLEMPDISHWDYSKVTSYENFMDEGKTVAGKPWTALFTSQSSTATQSLERTEETTEPDYGKSGKIVNILLVGHDSRPGEVHKLADTTILLTLNKETRTLTLTSFLRDSYVKLPDYYRGHVCGWNRINTAYALGYSWFGDTGAMDMLNLTIQNNFGIEIDGNVEVSFDSFTEIIDFLGGMELDITQEETDYLNILSGLYATRHLEPGPNVLTGRETLWYARMRHLNAEDNDFKRANRQRMIIEKILNDCKTMSVPELNELLDTVLPMITTNITPEDMKMYISELLPYIFDVEFVSNQCPAEGTSREETVELPDGAGNVLKIDFDKNKQLMMSICEEAD